MPAHKATQFTGRLFVCERNRSIAFRQPPVFAGKQPSTPAEELANSKQKPQWQRGGDGQACAVEKINDRVEHCWSGRVAPASLREAAVGRVDLPAGCFNQYNVPSVATLFSF